MPNQIQTTHRDISWFKQAHELHQLEFKAAIPKEFGLDG